MSNTSLLGSFGGQAGDALMFRNRILNGAMEICQRYGTTARTPTASEYVLDRWQLQVTQASKLTVQQTFTGGSSSIGFPAYMGISGSTAYSPLNTDFFAMRQCIEGFNIADLGWGTAAAKPITISFLVNCTKTGTFSGSLTNGDSGARRSYAFTYTVNSVNTWEYKTITIPGDTSGNWYTDNREGINLYLDCGSGSNYRTTAGAWGAGTFVGATGSYSLVSNLPATLYITGVQLEAGPVSTPFERRPIGQEILLCQRYFEKSYNIDVAPGTATGLGQEKFAGIYYAPGSLLYAGGGVRYKVVKRVPATTITRIAYDGTVGQWHYGVSGLSDARANTTIFDSGATGFTLYLSSVPSGQNIMYGHWTADAEL